MPAPQVAISPKGTYENVRLFASNSNEYHQYKITDLRSNDVLIRASQEILNLQVESKSRISDELSKVIIDSKYILNLKDNWDDDGAISISKNAYNNAILFLKSYSERVIDVWGSEKKCFLPPSISPVKDGSVDLEWNLDRSYLLINFPDSKEDFVYYYLAFKDGDNITFDANGQINIRIVNDKFASQILDLS